MLRPVLRRPLTIESRAEARQDIGHILDEVCVQLLFVDHPQLSVARPQGCFDIVRSESGKAVPMLHDDDGVRRVLQNSQETLAMTVQPRTDFFELLHHVDATHRSVIAEPVQLPFQVLLLVARGDPCIKDGIVRPAWKLVHENGAGRKLFYGAWELPAPEEAVGGLVVNSVLSCPVCQLHIILSVLCI